MHDCLASRPPGKSIMMRVQDRLPQHRREAIAARLRDGAAVSASALAREFEVSEDAIRRDLRDMAAAGLCQRVYGGALPVSGANVSLQVRSKQAVERKRALARAALGLIRPGDTLFIDNSSTNTELAALLPDDQRLRVITNSLPVGLAVMTKPGVELYVIGGRVDPHLGGVVGVRAVAELRQFRADLCVLGTCAVSVAHGLAGFDIDDVDFKSAALAISGAAVTLVTNEKLETTATHVIAPIAGIDHLVIEHDAPAALVKALGAAGPSILSASA
jgi:DeoR/GlpR family transcriptional regulator of sugar metabolism